MAELSIIIPGVGEWPVIAFTVRSVYEELRDRADFEIIYVDNFCPEVAAQGREPDRTVEYLEQMARGWPWLKVLRYTDKLSHWCAKRLGVQHSTGRFIQFLDAHVVPSRDSIYNQHQFYRENHEELNGVLHLPVTYHVCEYHKLMYKLVTELDKGHVHYSFTGYQEKAEPYTVPCMTTDGMMISRELYDYMGGIPSELGIWGGGENFINFTLAVLGKNVWICAGSGMNNTLNHHGDKRGYAYNYDDLCRNRCIAAYMYGGHDFADLMMNHYKGNPKQLEKIFRSVVDNDDCRKHRELIESRQKTTIHEWVRKWT